MTHKLKHVGWALAEVPLGPKDYWPYLPEAPRPKVPAIWIRPETFCRTRFGIKGLWKGMGLTQVAAGAKLAIVKIYAEVGRIEKEKANESAE